MEQYHQSLPMQEMETGKYEISNSSCLENELPPPITPTYYNRRISASALCMIGTWVSKDCLPRPSQVLTLDPSPSPDTTCCNYVDTLDDGRSVGYKAALSSKLARSRASAALASAAARSLSAFSLAIFSSSRLCRSASITNSNSLSRTLVVRCSALSCP